MKNTAFLLAGLLLLQPVFAQDRLTQRLDDLVSAYSRSSRFNGSVLVAQQGKILLAKGYGIRNADDHSSNDAHTIYQIASMTKQFTATVILKLVELKKMSLQDRLSKYYTGFPNGDSITMEHLLTHTAGLHNFTEGGKDIEETDEKRMVPYLRTLKPDFPPGTDWHYSNSGYVMLGFIIQKVSAMSYWKAIRTYIFQPLQMSCSGFDFIHFMDGNKAVGYDILSDSARIRARITDSTVPFGAGAIYSTVEDLYKWHRGLQAYQIVGKSLMELAYSSCRLHHYGFGWQIDTLYGKRILSHSGSISGFGSNIARVTDDDICIAILSNRSGSTADVIHVTDGLLAVLYNQPYRLPVKRVPVVLPQAVLKRYTGTYDIPGVKQVEIVLESDQLVVLPFHSVLCANDQTTFYTKEDEDIEVRFDIDAGGKVNAVIIKQAGVTKTCPKIK